MELSDVLARIELRLKATKLSADKASRLAGKPDAIRNMRRAIKDGVRVGVSTDTISALAPVLSANPAWLLTGEGSANPAGIRLVGHVGADARPDVVVFTDVQGDIDDDIPIPPERTPSTVAVIVKGNSMRSIARDGWVIYFNDSDVKVGPTTFDSLYGELCICWLVDGRVLLKELHQGRRMGYSLLISTNDEPLSDVMVEKAVKVTFIAPRGPRPKSDRLIANDEQDYQVKKA